MRKHLTYANVAATIAVVFAMAGTAAAASHYLINSTKQIRPRVLKALRGRQGPPGPFPGSLPHGKTLRGAWSFESVAPGSASGAVSFEFALASKPNSEVIGLGAASTEHCPGTAADPRAASGYFCAYVANYANVKMFEIYGDASDFEAGASRFGASVYGQTANNTLPVFGEGTWAVTG